CGLGCRGFIFLGFSDQPHLEAVLFMFVLFFYLLSLLGNTAIMVVSHLDSCFHTAMYFFLNHLSFLNLCFYTILAPQTLVNLWGPKETITFGGCVVQLYVSLGLGSTECGLLALMALDLYTAVCQPLCYAMLMHPSLCRRLAALILCLPQCGHHHLDHFICEVPALIKLACMDTTISELVLFTLSILVGIVPLAFILVSYGFIAWAVMRVGSSEGRRMVFSTCFSHLLGMSIFYGTIIFMYLQPGGNYSQDQGKFVSLFYTMVTPTLNPIIYTLRNQEVKGALNKMVLGGFSLGRTEPDWGAP
uniref:G-protein coupled receptors family 1 profile domain-containing protein n=1 Tax=Ornithorhynchus anatinus TaxID=9258 RepID=F6S392_ORNAN